MELAKDGYRTYATMRDTAKGKTLLDEAQKGGLSIDVLELDVNSADSINEAVARIVSESGRLDVLVNNAGYAIIGAVEDVPIDDFRAQFETNLFGVINTIKHAIPVMRSQGSGHIINISSVAGRMGFPGSAAYISSKFALEGLSESLRYELDQFGVKVVIIEPGVIKTNFFDAMKIMPASEPNRDLTDRVMAGIKMMVSMGTSPVEVAKTVIRALHESDPLPRYVVGNDAKMFLEAQKLKTDIEFENYIKKELFD